MLRKQTNRVIALDSGALLFKEIQVQPDQAQQQITTAQGILSAYNAMSFAAVGVARQDLAAGLSFLLSIQSKSNFPWLSANLVSRAQGKPYFKPHALLTISGMNVAVIGLTDGQGADHFVTEQDNAVILPWEEVLPKEIEQLQGKSDMLILLSSLSVAENRKIAEKYPEVHLILQSGAASGNMSPELIHNTLITQTEQKGKSIGILEVRWNTLTKKWKDLETEKLLLEKENALDRLGWQINRYHRQGDPKLAFKDQPDVLAVYNSLLGQQQKLTQEIESLTSKQKIIGPQNSRLSSFTSRFVAMRKELPDHPAVQAIVELTTKEVNRLGKEAAKARAMETNGQQHLYSPDNYAGNTACQSCHPLQFKKWRSTKHATAYETLEKKGQQFNSQCLPCHVTGAFGQPEAMVLILSSDLRQVGCESCHGPGKQHVAQPQSARLTQPAMDTCLRCHTGDHDDNFIFSEALARLHCGTP